VPCYKCQQKCNIGEFVDELICKPACNVGRCVMDYLSKCWKCPKQDCEDDEYTEQDDCEEGCDGPCRVNEDSNCWYCPLVTCEDIDKYSSEDACQNYCEEPDVCEFKDDIDCWECVESEATCEDRGMYSDQGSCEGECDEPDYCVYSENYDCWQCQGVTCTGSLHDESDCDGDCNENEGEVCVKHQSGCYWCVCPDLYVNSLSGSVHRSASTHCSTGEYGLEVCTTECSLSGTAQFKIKNKGTGPAGASTARVDLMSSEDALVDSETESVGALGAGQTSSTMTVDLAKYAEVVGKTCDGLDWWTSTYTMWVFADYGDAVKECDEDNNDIHAETSAS
jgi:hypothetical protein